jgi:hypothetical protein
MTAQELNTIANKWFAAFNEQQLENLLSLYHDNAEHYSPKLKARHPETNGFIKGKAAMRGCFYTFARSSLQSFATYAL